MNTEPKQCEPKQQSQQSFFKDPILQKFITLQPKKIFISPNFVCNLSSIEETELIKLIVCILERKKPEDRTLIDLQIIKAGLQSFLFFDRLNQLSDLPESNFNEYCKYLQVEVGMEGQYVFQKGLKYYLKTGDKGDKFYIILSGIADILIPQEQSIQTNGYQYNEIQRVWQNKIVMKKVNEIQTKGHFGELALLNDTPRLASVRCNKMCIFGTLDKASFNNIIAQSKINQLKVQTQFFQSIQLFSKLTKNYLQTLICYFSLDTFQMNQIVYREEDLADKIYIVKQGEVQQLSKLKFKLTKLIEVKRNGVQENLKITSEIMNQKKILKLVQFATVSIGQIFGDLDSLTGQKRQFTATAQIVGSQAYVINKKEFRQRVLDRNTNIQARIFTEHYLKEKLDYANQRMTTITQTLEDQSPLIFGSFIGKDILTKRHQSQSNAATMQISSIRVRTEVSADQNDKINNSSKTNGIQSYFSSKSYNDQKIVVKDTLSHLGQFVQRIKPFKKINSSRKNLYDEFMISDKIKKMFYNRLLKLKINERVSEMNGIVNDSKNTTSPKSQNFINSTNRTQKRAHSVRQVGLPKQGSSFISQLNESCDEKRFLLNSDTRAVRGLQQIFQLQQSKQRPRTTKNQSQGQNDFTLHDLKFSGIKRIKTVF